MFMGLIVWLIVGAIIGWLASLITRTEEQRGILASILIGLIGAVAAGLITTRGHINESSMLDITNTLWSVVGAVVLLAAYYLIRRYRPR
jgi:uncharacterized membrane protein YeaQ/YmgE (transglycosylase-associated protein family)